MIAEYLGIPSVALSPAKSGVRTVAQRYPITVDGWAELSE